MIAIEDGGLKKNSTHTKIWLGRSKAQNMYSKGYKVPMIYHIGDKAKSLPKFRNLPERFVIKPTKGWSAKNVFVMVDGVNLLDQKKWKRNQIVKSLEKNSVG